MKLYELVFIINHWKEKEIAKNATVCYLSMKEEKEIKNIYIFANAKKKYRQVQPETSEINFL